MAAQSVLRSLLGELLDCAAGGRAEEAPEAWASVEKHIKWRTCQTASIDVLGGCCNCQSCPYLLSSCPANHMQMLQACTSPSRYPATPRRAWVQERIRVRR